MDHQPQLQDGSLGASVPTPSLPPPRRVRGRSSAVTVNSNPIEAPLTAEDQKLARLVQTIKRDNNREAKQATPSAANPIFEQSDNFSKFQADLEREYKRAKLREQVVLVAAPPSLEQFPQTSVCPSKAERIEQRSQELLLKESAIRASRNEEVSKTIKREEGRSIAHNMSYQNYLDASGSNPRQAPPSPSQSVNHTNGVNGGASGIAGMTGFPTPAGHQSDLNYIMGMVEELSRQLEHNQRLTSGVVEKIGKVREKAQNIDLNNDELIALVAAELNEDTKNLEKECSTLRKKLEKAEYNRDENWKLAIHGCNILSDILEKMHKYKEQHEMDTLAWHKNYRKQLADEREENLALRNQINDMRAAACRANEWLRKLRRAINDNDEVTELRIQNIALRQEKRFWKRMALPELADDDSEWSDDDDLIDPEEKKRQAAETAEKERKEKEAEAEGSPGQTS